MNRVKQLAALALLMISLGSHALAKGQVDDVNSKVFVLRGPTKPAPVITLKEATKQKKEFMRMPDLGGDESRSATVHSSEIGNEGFDGQRSSHVAGMKSKDGKSKSTLRAALSSSESRLPKAMHFGTVKISGTLRLPRVKFARVGVAMDVRDEMPSLDFTQKSLKDSGF